MHRIVFLAVLLSVVGARADMQIDFDPQLLPVNGVVLDVIAEIGQEGDAASYSSTITGPSGQPQVWHAVWNLDDQIMTPTQVQSLTVHIDCGGELVTGTFTPEPFTVFYHPGPLLPPPALTEFEGLDPEQVCEAVSIDEGASRPASYGLRSIWPNPFNPTTRVEFHLPSAAKARLEVFDLRGALREVLLDGALDAGVHQLDWQPAGLASGVYILQLSSGEFKDQRKALLLR